ncbi:MAG: phosphoglycerate kinase [Candidatus Micrarchaeota archaeon]
MNFSTLDNVELKGKTVFCRADLNCPLNEKKKPILSGRIIAHAKTIYELHKKGAKTIILSHQGRKGKDDFISLKYHASLLSKQVSKLANLKIKIKFINDVCGKKAKRAIKNLSEGGIILLENTRFVDCETEFEKTKKCEIIENLSPFCDIFVLDAFSVSHRAHASVVGFKGKCPCIAGRVMEEELTALLKINENPSKPSIAIFGGAKPSDSVPIIKNWLEKEKTDFVLCGGALANLMLIASGKEIGSSSYEFLEKQQALECLPIAKEIIEKYSDKINLPVDLIVDENGKPNKINISSLPTQYPIFDIGPSTCRKYIKLISSASSIFLNGPMGVYEKKEFAKGTKKILRAISENSNAFSVLGGGHTISALKKFRLPHSKFGYVSLSGKALVEFLSGKSLPGVEMLY